MKKFLMSAGAAVMALGAVAIAQSPTSGLNVGERISVFHPAHVAGPFAGSDRCFPCTVQARPQAQIWVNGESASNLSPIVKALESAMTAYSSKEFKAMVVVLSAPNQVEATKANAKRMAADMGVKNVAVAVLPNNDAAVRAYKFNMGVKNTVFAYRNWELKAKMVNLKGDNAGVGSLNAAIRSLVQ